MGSGGLRSYKGKIMETVLTEGQTVTDEQYFRQLISRMGKTVSKVRRIDVAELLEWAWVDGKLEPFAARLTRSCPDIADEIELILADLRTASHN